MSFPAGYKVLVFGASGQIGLSIVETLAMNGCSLTAVSRNAARNEAGNVNSVAFDPFTTDAKLWCSALMPDDQPFDAVVWAQGVNLNDSIEALDWQKYLETFNANCNYVALTLNVLLNQGIIKERGARLCVISSIWQTRARQNKFSYIVSKAALQGLVLSASVDLAFKGHLINAVLPGALQTPMTGSVLAPEQIAAIASSTGFDRLANLSDVSELTAFLCSPKNTSITGQFMAVDLGYQNARIV